MTGSLCVSGRRQTHQIRARRAQDPLPQNITPHTMPHIRYIQHRHSERDSRHPFSFTLRRTAQALSRSMLWRLHGDVDSWRDLSQSMYLVNTPKPGTTTPVSTRCYRTTQRLRLPTPGPTAMTMPMSACTARENSWGSTSSSSNSSSLEPEPELSGGGGSSSIAAFCTPPAVASRVVRIVEVK